MEESLIETIPAFGPKPQKPVNKRFIYLVLTILFLIVAFFSYKIFGPKTKGAISNNSAAVVAYTPTLPISNTVTTIPTVDSSITPILNPIDKTTGLDRSKLSVTIQNGSGEEGVAGKAMTLLKNLGYDVASTGNADNFDYINVVVQVKNSSGKYLSLLKTDLGLNYTIGSASADLPNSFSSQALVIIGK
jgi:hypothetical protein